MCVVSMIMDHSHDQWNRRWDQYRDLPAHSHSAPEPIISLQEIEEFKRLLERAREYDKRNNEPDCEMEDKKQKLLKLAEELGVKIDFIREENN